MKISKQILAVCLAAGMTMGAAGLHSSFAARAIVDGAIRGVGNGNKPIKLVPTITSFTATASLKLKSVVTVVGTNFVAGSTLTLIQGTRLIPTPVVLAADGASLTFTPTTGTAAGLYNLRISNAGGSITSISNLRVTL